MHLPDDTKQSAKRPIDGTLDIAITTAVTAGSGQPAHVVLDIDPPLEESAQPLLNKVASRLNGIESIMTIKRGGAPRVIVVMKNGAGQDEKALDLHTEQLRLELERKYNELPPPEQQRLHEPVDPRTALSVSSDD